MTPKIEKAFLALILALENERDRALTKCDEKASNAAFWALANVRAARKYYDRDLTIAEPK